MAASERLFGRDQYPLSSFPFDPSARIEFLEGLDKLRAVEDRATRAVLYELYWSAEAYESSPHFERAEERRVRRAARREVERLNAIADKAAKGEWGFSGRALEKSMLGEGKERTLDALREFERQLRALRAELEE